MTSMSIAIVLFIIQSILYTSIGSSVKEFTRPKVSRTNYTNKTHKIPTMSSFDEKAK